MSQNGHHKPRKDAIVKVPPAIAYVGNPDQYPRLQFEELLARERDPAKREALLREKIRFLDAELAAERTATQRQSLAAEMFSTYLMAFVDGIVSDDEFGIYEQAVMLPKAIVSRVQGRSLEIGTSDLGDVVMRIVDTSEGKVVGGNP